jgi:hypothetical protein
MPTIPGLMSSIGMSRVAAGSGIQQRAVSANATVAVRIFMGFELSVEIAPRLR